LKEFAASTSTELWLWQPTTVSCASPLRAPLCPSWLTNLLSFPMHSPKRTHAKPSECQCERNCSDNMSSAGLSGMKFSVLAKKSECADTCHRQKHRSHHFQPELVRDPPERSQRRANRPFRGADGAIASRLFSGNSRHHADFLPGRNFAHALDFSSLRRYNDRTAIEGRPFLAPRHLRAKGDILWIRNSSS
jgi:hypothetical protein